jgi:hypothetical protein
MRKDALLRGTLLGGLSLAAAVAVLTAVAIPVVALAAPSPAPSPSASSAVYAENRYQPARLTIKPHGYYSHVSVHNLNWTNWGQPSTSARGTFTFQFCVQESCTVSPFYDEPVVVSLSQIKRCRARLSYTVLSLAVEGPLPDASFKTYRTSLASCRPRSSGGRRTHG